MLSCTPREGGYALVLEETIFYPTGGGQPHDSGTVNDLPVLDVYETEGTIYHLLPEPIKESRVTCCLDWRRRLDHMQQHTGQHLLSAVLLTEFGCKTESFHLGTDYSSIDISPPCLSDEQTLQAENLVNQLIFAAKPIQIYTVTPEELKTLPVRKLPDLAGDLRIVEIEGVDYSPCSGTHLAQTAQLGMVKLIRTEKYKGMIRVYFLCGMRAREDYGLKHRICTELGSLLSVPVTELPARTAKELDEKRQLKQEIDQLKAEVMDLRAQAIVEGGNDCPFLIEMPGASLEEARLLANAVFKLGVYGVVINLDNHLVLAHNSPGSLHCGQLVKEHGPAMGGRGGGSAFNAQVFFTEPDKKAEFYRFLRSNFQVLGCGTVK